MTGPGVYTGRYAPSPTGPLHFGSLVAAMGSFLQARAHQGRWLLRIENIDPPREVPGAATSILKTLERLGFEWDGPAGFQADNSARHRDVLDELRTKGQVYACECSRKQIEAYQAQHGLARGVYPRLCAHKNLPAGGNCTRVHVQGSVQFDDVLQGSVREDLENDVGDFVVWRRDGLVAYQLAVVVDDADQGITDVVRGADLLDNTARQIFLQQLLGFRTPGYAHLPVAVDRTGKKLSKQTHARPIDDYVPLQALLAAWEFLAQQRPDVELSDVEDFWRWAARHWHLSLVPPVSTRPATLQGVEP